jgi:3-phosphoshikimate 1-carboxyvinyltransferase
MSGLLELTVPGDKSISHRALLLAALAEGESRLTGLLCGADTEATAAGLRALGCAIPPLTAGPVVVRGLGLRGARAPAAALECGNSGTTARLLLGILAAQPVTATLDGDASLRSRPMRRVTHPLAAAGARFRELGAPDRLPIRVSGGPLREIRHESPVASAQVKSALLLAGLCAGVPVELWEPVLSRDHTERLLQALGAPVRRTDGAPGPGGASGAAVALGPVARLAPLELRVPGDFSAAAFLLGRGLLDGPGVRIPWVGVNPTRTGLLAVLARMGARVELRDASDAGHADDAGEPVATLVARPGEPLAGTRVHAGEVPALVDEIPLLAALAARAVGETRIEGAGELRVKESDRIATMVDNLRAVGVAADALPDGLVVSGRAGPLRGAVRTHGDHRIAMAFGLLASLPGNDIAIDDPHCVAVSFPGFWDALGGFATAAPLP